MPIQETISKISFFDSLDDEQKDIIASISTVIKYPKNSILYYESDVTKNILFLVEGFDQNLQK